MERRRVAGWPHGADGFRTVEGNRHATARRVVGCRDPRHSMPGSVRADEYDGVSDDRRDYGGDVVHVSRSENVETATVQFIPRVVAVQHVGNEFVLQIEVWTEPRARSVVKDVDLDRKAA